jgi:hypothetical protein
MCQSEIAVRRARVPACVRELEVLARLQYCTVADVRRSTPYLDTKVPGSITFGRDTRADRGGGDHRHVKASLARSRGLVYKVPKRAIR